MRQRELAELVPLPVLVTDERGVIHDANTAAAALLRIPARYLIGKPLGIYAADRRALFALLDRVAVPPAFATTTLRPRGAEPLVVHAVVRRSLARAGAGELLWVIWGGEETVAPSAAAVHGLVQERDARAVSEFLTSAAHELQTPITAILSAVDVLQAGAKEVPEDRERFLAHVQWEALRLARLVRALLAVAHARTGQHVKRETVRLAPLLDEVALSLAPAPGVEVVVRCADGVAVWGDRNLVEQIVANLALNAAKFTQSGTIELVAAVNATGKVVMIEVRDTGSGISPSQARRAFAPFVRGAPEGDGFGLGLSIVREAVDALGGSITLEPQAERGTIATVTLVGRAVALP